MKINKVLRRDEIIKFIARLYDGDLHAKRVLSLGNATVGVLTSASLAVHAIGQGLAQAMGKLSMHGVKQVDRLLSKQGVDVWEFFGYWVAYMVGARSEVVVALDWTSFAQDAHETIVISMLTGHGRATPLLWKTVQASMLKGKRNRYEAHPSPHFGLQIRPNTSRYNRCSMSTCANFSINGRRRCSGQLGMCS